MKKIHLIAALLLINISQPFMAMEKNDKIAVAFEDSSGYVLKEDNWVTVQFEDSCEYVLKKELKIFQTPSDLFDDLKKEKKQPQVILAESWRALSEAHRGPHKPLFAGSSFGRVPNYNFDGFAKPYLDLSTISYKEASIAISLLKGRSYLLTEHQKLTQEELAGLVKLSFVYGIKDKNRNEIFRKICCRERNNIEKIINEQWYEEIKRKVIGFPIEEVTKSYLFDRLKIVNLSDLKIENIDEIARVFCKNNSIEELSLAHNRLNEDKFALLFKTFPCLKNLNLSNNYIYTISSGIFSAPSGAFISLNDNPIENYLTDPDSENGYCKDVTLFLKRTRLSRKQVEDLYKQISKEPLEQLKNRRYWEKYGTIIKNSAIYTPWAIGIFIFIESCTGPPKPLSEILLILCSVPIIVLEELFLDKYIKNKTTYIKPKNKIYF